MKLVIVESPAKAKTIESILGKGYKVISSFGHIRDLAKDGDKNTGIEIAKNYKPHYVVPDEKKHVVADLKRKIKGNEVILATDEDREGEAISWHIVDELKLNSKKTKRIVFTEITPDAIKRAIENPRTVDKALVDAQQARRILDRLVGFELSGLLWKKVRGKLSAGRVQSVAVKLIVEREEEIKKFKPKSFFKITGHFKGTKSARDTFKAELSDNLKDVKTAKAFLKACTSSKFTVKGISVKPHSRKPSPPFTTSTMQQLASQKLGFSVSRTMSTAQRLYEAGHITYMRTDSISISNTALKQMANYIKKEYSEKYLEVRKFKSASKSAQEAHEAIRPTYVKKEKVSANRDQQKLYSLIRTRALASQMANAQVEKTTVEIEISKDKKRQFIAKGEIILFDGFLKLYKKAMADEVFLPKLTEGQEVFEESIEALERHTKPPARYSEATLVKKLEELGIGRPSTYAPTIEKITAPSRGYVTKETREGEPVDYALLIVEKKAIKESTKSEVTGTQKNKLFAHDIGKLVTDFLEDHFTKIMNYSFTAGVEDKLDDIAAGKEKWVEVIDDYYKPFHKTVEKTLDKAERVTGERILGKDPKTKRTLLVRMSRYGPVAQIGAPDELKEDEKPQYASLRKDQDLETITAKEALELFILPRSMGKYKDAEVSVQIGRFGPYVKYGEKNVSLPKESDPYTISKKDVYELIDEKEKLDKPIGHFEDLPITKGIGRFGPFVKWNNLYASISKKSGFSFEKITEKQAIQLVKEKKKKEEEKIIQSWPEEKLSIQNGRWGPFIKVDGDRKFYKLPQGSSGKRMTVAEAKRFPLKKVKEIVKKQK